MAMPPMAEILPMTAGLRMLPTSGSGHLYINHGGYVITIVSGAGPTPPTVNITFCICTVLLRRSGLQQHLRMSHSGLATVAAN